MAVTTQGPVFNNARSRAVKNPRTAVPLEMLDFPSESENKNFIKMKKTSSQIEILQQKLFCNLNNFSVKIYLIDFILATVDAPQQKYER